MRYFLKALVVAIVGCTLITMLAPVIRIACLSYQTQQAATEFQNELYSPAEARLDRYEAWTAFFPAIRRQVLCQNMRCKIRLGKIEEARAISESFITWRPASVPSVMDAPLAFIRSGPDWIANKVHSALSGNTQGWDAEMGRDVLLDELWQAGMYDELVASARAILAVAPDNQSAKKKLAVVENRQKAAKVVQRPGTTRPAAGRGTAQQPAANRAPGRAPEVTIAGTGVSPAAAQGGTFEEQADDGAGARKEQELKAREAELTTRLNARRKTLSDSRPPTEAERTRDAAQRRLDDLTARSRKLESEANSATGQKRINALEQLRPMKGQVARCQGELKSATAAADAAGAKRRAAIGNDPDVKSLEKDLAEVRDALQNP
ncbi:MAG: hypothetical protein WCL44_01520 [bacterium]